LLLAGALGALLAPATAGATTGALTPDGCIEDAGTGSDDCVVYGNDLAGAAGVEVSPDGKTVVAVTGLGTAGGSVSSFFRNPPTTLTNFGCLSDNDGVSNNCSSTVSALGGAAAIAHSPDGKSVYVASEDDDAIVIFDRDPATGSLDPAGCVDDNDFATDPNQGKDVCAKSADGLDGATGVAVSADGQTVYATSERDHAVAIFDRSLNGGLTPLGCWDDNDTGADAGCAHTANGLGRPNDVAVSPDGKSVYVTSLLDDAVVHLHRETATGLLTAAECYDDNDFATDPNQGPDTCLLAGETDGLNGARSVAVSPDNVSVYVAGGTDDAIVSFTRDPADGDLTPAGCRSDNDTGTDCPVATRVDGLDSPSSVAVSPDALSVYVGSQIDDAVVRFDRAVNGSLTTQGCIDDNDTATDPTQGEDSCAQSTNGLRGVTDAAVSPDGRGVFATGAFDKALVRFTREDSTPPQTNFTAGPANGSILTGSAAYEFTSSEPLSTFLCGTDLEFDIGGCTSPHTFFPPPPQFPGQHEFNVFAVDPSGNADPTPAARTFIVPEPPPPPPPPTETTPTETPPTGTTPAPSTPTSPAPTTRRCRKGFKLKKVKGKKGKRCVKKKKKKR
jgi:DNA-binding beta-propeller fold protein YncE